MRTPATLWVLLGTSLAFALPVHAATGSPHCVPHATAAALTHLGHKTSTQEIARELFVRQDGVDVFELALWLDAQGVPGMVVAPSGDVLGRALNAGLPIVAVRPQGKGAHAVALLPTASASDVRVADIRVAGTSRKPRKQALLGLKVAVVLWSKGKPAPVRGLGGHAVWKQLVRTDAEFRSSGWLRRAAAHERPNAQALTLAKRAVAAAPWYAPAQKALRRIEAGLAAKRRPRRPGKTAEVRR